MRILVVSNCPILAHLGSGYVIGGYVERLRARGFEVVTLEPDDYEWLPRLRGGKRLRVLAGYSLATLRRVARGRFDIVELWGAESWWVARRLARRKSRPLLIARSNGLEPHLSEELARHGLGGHRSRAGAWFDSWQDDEAAFRVADGLTVMSEFDRRFALERGYQPEDRLLRLPAPLRDDWLGLPLTLERPRVLGFLGSLLPAKGARLLAAALVPVLRARPEWRVKVVGAKDFDAFSFFPADLVGRVEVAPFTEDRAAIRGLYAGMAVFAMPSAFESFGLMGVEAMACGCALIASPTGFAADLEGGVDAVLVSSWTVEAWAAALDPLLADEERRRSIARRGHARVQSLRWDDAVHQLLAFYGRLERRRTGCAA